MKKNRLRFVTGLLLVLLGTAHTAFTPHFYKTFDLQSVWFAGSGLALMFLGALNLVGNVENVCWFLCVRLFANILGTAFMIAIVCILPAPQAFIGVAFSVTLSACAIAEVIHCNRSSAVSSSCS